MHLRKLTLDNFKSHSHTVAEFAPGTNAICGKNYAGKTTLVQAIGLALFDCSPGTQSHFIRDGANAATLSVELISALDQRVYQVTRRIGNAPSWQVRDPKTGQVLVGNKKDVADWLCDHLGLGRETHLSSLFDGAVGVPQGELTSAFTQVESSRRPHFNKLLRLEEYETAYRKMQEAEKLVERQIGDAREAVAHLEGKTRDLPDKQEALKVLEKEIAGLETDQETLHGKCLRLQGEKQAGDDASARLERLKMRVSLLSGWDVRRTARLTSAQARLTDAENASILVSQSEPGHSRYVATASEVARLQPLVQKRTSLIDQKIEWQRKHSVVESLLDGLKAQMSEVEDAEREVTRLTPMVLQQEELEENKAIAQNAAAQAKADLKVAREGQRSSREGLCPFFQEKCRNAEATGRTLTQFFDERMAALEGAVSAAAFTLRHAEGALAALGLNSQSPRTLRAVAEAGAAKRTSLEAQITAQDRKFSDAVAAIDGLDISLLPYATLDMQMANCGSIMADNLADFDAHRLNLPLSHELTQCRTDHTRACAATKRVREALERRRAQRDAAQNAFDPTSYQRVSLELSEVLKTHDQTTGLLVAKMNRRTELETEIAGLRSEVEILEAARRERDRLKVLLEHLGVVRTAIRNAGPQVTARLVARISQDAERLFRTLIGDQSLGLRWTEDYEVLLRENGVERGLSPAAGSERVAAAIALRLAILQHMGGVRFAFFDEPTVHLDEERRDSLVGRLMSLPYFTQMFVISHDDTFERATDHVIHVEKKDGQSVVRMS
jgi:exonuclease SbcC